MGTNIGHRPLPWAWMRQRSASTLMQWNGRLVSMLLDEPLMVIEYTISPSYGGSVLINYRLGLRPHNCQVVLDGHCCLW
jgi:hypothetical protein